MINHICEANNFCFDVIWDEIDLFLNSHYLANSGILTKDTIKYKVLKGDWFLFKGDQCFFIGYFIYAKQKQFFITMIGGRTLKNDIYDFIEYIRVNYDCNSFVGIYSLAMGRIYRKLLNDYFNFRSLNWYEIDLKNLALSSDNPTSVLQFYNYDNWRNIVYDNLELINKYNFMLNRDIVFQTICENNLIVFKCHECYVIGRIDIEFTKKVYHIVFISDIIIPAIINVFSFIRYQLKCRYIRYFDNQERQVNLDSLKCPIVKRQLTIFERKLNG